MSKKIFYAFLKEDAQTAFVKKRKFLFVTYQEQRGRFHVEQ